jgi:cobalt-zinc-cadmium resistance protein CzcA
VITAKSKQKQLETLYKQSLQDVLLAKEQLKSVVQVEQLNIVDQPLQKLKMKNVSTEDNLGIQYFEDTKDYQNALYQKEKQNLFPDISLEYFQGTNDLLKNTVKGYQIGLKIPLFFSGNSAKIKASKIARNIVKEEQQNYNVKLKTAYNSLLAILHQNEEAINYYETEGKNLKNEIFKIANISFKEGEIDFFQYIQSLETSKEIELSYLDHLNAYNQTIIKINYLILNTL